MECISYRWAPGIGDPTIFGWLTVLLYVVAAVLSFLKAREGFSNSHSGIVDQRFFWLGLSILLSLLAVNKQLDLQSLLTAAGRCLAHAQGWYEGRGAVQRGFILMLAVSALLGGSAVLWLMRGQINALRLPLLGTFLLVLFVLMRASSFHHMDVFINTQLLGLRLNWVVEIGALVLIILGARGRTPYQDKRANQSR